MNMFNNYDLPLSKIALVFLLILLICTILQRINSLNRQLDALYHDGAIDLGLYNQLLNKINEISRKINGLNEQIRNINIADMPCEFAEAHDLLGFSSFHRINDRWNEDLSLLKNSLNESKFKNDAKQILDTHISEWTTELVEIQTKNSKFITDIIGKKSEKDIRGLIDECFSTLNELSEIHTEHVIGANVESISIIASLAYVMCKITGNLDYVSTLGSLNLDFSDILTIIKKISQFDAIDVVAPNKLRLDYDAIITHVSKNNPNFLENLNKIKKIST